MPTPTPQPDPPPPPSTVVGLKIPQLEEELPLEHPGMETEVKSQPRELLESEHIGDEQGESETADQSPDMLRILRGDFTNLPPAKSNIIRIFLSSTFSGK